MSKAQAVLQKYDIVEHENMGPLLISRAFNKKRQRPISALFKVFMQCYIPCIVVTLGITIKQLMDIGKQLRQN